MAMSCVVTHSKTRRVKAVIWTWTSAADGSAGADSPAISGEIVRVVSNPGATAPTAAWDFVINDADGFDVCAGKGANRSATATEAFCPLTGDGTTTNQRFAVDGVLTLAVTNAGDTKDGVITLYYI